MDVELDAIRKGLRAMLPFLEAKYGVQRLWVFGSRARKDHRTESDLDLLVEFGEKKPTLFGFAGLELELQDALGVKVELVERRAIRPDFVEQIEREAVAV